MSGIFRRFRSLAHSDKLRFGAAVLLVPFLKVCLLTFGFKKTVKLLKLFPGRQARKSGNTVARYRDLVKLCYEIFPFNGLCLPISLTFWWMLRREGIETTLYFGANKIKENLTAHAWIEYRGIPITPDRDDNKKYHPLEIPIG